MKTTNLVLSAGVLVALGLGVACSAAPKSDDDELYVVQVARVNADGTITMVSERTITAAQEREENAARLAGLLTVRATHSGDLSLDSVNSDSSCAANDNWIYDQQNQMGNRLCLYGTAPFTTCTSMSNFAHPGGGTWNSYVQSFWTGNENGYFQCVDLFCPSAGWATFTKYNGCSTCAATICFSN